MSDEPKKPVLATEAEWLHILGGSGRGKPIIEELRERGLIASEPVDPHRQLIEAVVRAYNTPRTIPDYVPHILGKHYVKDALAQIEREKRPALTRDAIAEAIYAVMKSRDIERLYRGDFGPLVQTQTANAIIDALQEQLK